MRYKRAMWNGWRRESAWILLPAPKCQLFVEKFWYLTSSQGSRGKNAGISVFDQFARENMNRLWTFWHQCWYCHRIGNLLVLSSLRNTISETTKLCALVTSEASVVDCQPSWDGFMWNVKSTTRCISASLALVEPCLCLLSLPLDTLNQTDISFLPLKALMEPISCGRHLVESEIVTKSIFSGLLIERHNTPIWLTVAGPISANLTYGS